jgi:hypothetical protein
MLVEGLIVESAIVAAVGRWKTTKSYGMLDISISIATGRPAFGQLTIPHPGPVVFVNEEAGRAAAWRRLDALCRGRNIDPEELRGRLLVSASARVRLDDLEWQNRILELASSVEARLMVFDPLARMKAPGRNESAQNEMAAVIEFVRDLRDETMTAVAFVHHTGHQGIQMRGTSDLESVWETRLTWTRDGQAAEVKLTSEHRDAEPAEYRYRIDWDAQSRTMRFPLVEDALEARVRAALEADPEASANDIHKELGGKRTDVLRVVKELRGGGSHLGNHPGTTPAGQAPGGGSPVGLYEAPGTTTAGPDVTQYPFAGTTPDEEEVERLAEKARAWESER